MKQQALPIEHELMAEKASALAFTAEKLEAALRTLAAADPQSPEWGELRAHAAERLWFLLVQREAIGLYHHEGVLRAYGVPPELRLVAGPRRASSPSPAP